LWMASCERRESRARRAEKERAEALSSASDDEVGIMRAMREQLIKKGGVSSQP
jgi:hypothetical protein